MVFPHGKEVEDIGLTKQLCKRSKICLVFPKGEAMTHLVLSASFAFAITEFIEIVKQNRLKLRHLTL
jgi:hypothetical protein